MSNIPGNLRYSRSHEWAREESDGGITMGITDHAQELLGDLVYVETPEIGNAVQASEACAVVESVKAASDIYCPVTGVVVAVNEELADAPERVNQEPYEGGWMFRIKPDNSNALAGLMDAAAYQAHCDAEAH